MPKKLTYEFVKSSFEKEGYTLVSEEYKNNKTKLSVICPEDHLIKTLWNDWKSGVRCPVCSGKRRHTIEFVREEFNKEDYTLLSTKYKNKHLKLDYICPSGHRHSISYGNWRSGYRCPYCAGQGKPTIDYIRKEFEKCGYKLTSNKYVNSKTKLYYTCDKGHKSSVVWSNWKSGCRCYVCYRLSLSGPSHPNWKGGISCEPYCQDWTKEYKEYIKERDSNRCLNPYCVSKKPNDLTIHHIDYNKKNCRPGNLITICRSCNSKANTDRNWHKAWYKAIINKRYHL